MSEYVEYAEIAAALGALPVRIDWPLDKLIAFGRRTNSSLRFVRSGNRKSPPVWRRSDVENWFGKQYRAAPELVAQFAIALSGPTKLKPKTKIAP